MKQKINRIKTIPFSSRMEEDLKKAMVDFCDREGINVQRFLKDAVINELEKRRNGK